MHASGGYDRAVAYSTLKRVRWTLESTSGCDKAVMMEGNSMYDMLCDTVL